jgi:hypothetical protein
MTQRVSRTKERRSGPCTTLVMRELLAFLAVTS